jgi:hypothetical protein
MISRRQAARSIETATRCELLTTSLKTSSGGGTRTHNLDLNRILLCLIELPRTVCLDYPGDGTETCLHLRVAIRAQQDTLAGLGAKSRDATAHPPLRQPIERS